MNPLRKLMGNARRTGPGVLLLTVLAVAGCGREEIRVYRVPKEALPGQLAWKLPAGWKEGVASEISLANFHVIGANGKEADVSITRMGNLAGSEARLANMWRSKVGLPDISDEEAIKQFQPVEFAGEKGSLFEVKGSGVEGPVTLISAMLNHPDGSWFCKISGDAALVEAQRPVFLQFLNSINLPQGGEEVVASARPVSTNRKETPRETADAGLPAWNPPANWQQLPTPPMLTAKFLVPGAGSAKANVNIGIAGGSPLMNINRWRGQLGLAQVDETGLAGLLTPLQASGLKATLVDMVGTDPATSQPARMLGALVPQGDQFWVYKLMGDTAVVEKEKAAFVQFVQNVKYPNVP